MGFLGRLNGFKKPNDQYIAEGTMPSTRIQHIENVDSLPHLERTPARADATPSAPVPIPGRKQSHSDKLKFWKSSSFVSPAANSARAANPTPAANSIPATNSTPAFNRTPPSDVVSSALRNGDEYSDEELQSFVTVPKKTRKRLRKKCLQVTVAEGTDAKH